MNIGYSDFAKLCRVEDPENWVDWLTVRKDGIYVKEPPSGLTPDERAVLSQHSTGNLETPVLSFPCTLPEFQAFLEKQAVYGCLDPFDLAEWVIASRLERERLEPSNTLAARAETTYLNIIGGLLKLMLGKSPSGKDHSVYKNQTAIIDALVAHDAGKPGITRRTLEEKFSAANRSLTAT